MDDKGIRHMNAFYAVLKEWIGKKEYTTKLMMKVEYDKIVNFLLGVKEGTTDCCEEKKSGNASAYVVAKIGICMTRIPISKRGSPF